MNPTTKDMPDGVQVVNRGVNSGVPPNTIGRDQLAWLTNGTTRGGFPQNRPGWVKRTLKFLNADGSTDSTLQSNFQDNLFQGACAFTRKNQIVVSIGGRLFRIHLMNMNVVDVSVSGDLDRSDLRRAWLIEAEDFVIRQDNQAAALIFNGTSSRRADGFGVNGDKEVPSGNAMAYVNGRLWVSLPDQQSFMAGDIVYGASGTAAYGRRDAILKFTENDFWNGGGAFPIPLNAGKIRALSPIAQIDTSQGQGPLQVLTDGAVFSVNTPTSRADWQNVNYPIESISMPGAGSSSDRATVNVNGDIWTRAYDGIRSFMVGRRDFGTWVNSAQDREVIRATSLDDRNLLTYSSAALFDNRLLVTIAPYLDWDHGTLHRGLAVLDFNPVTSLLGQSTPVWDGAWSGIAILQILHGVFEGVERCFMFCLNDSDEIELWEITRDSEWDNDGTSDINIQWSMELPSLNWQDGGWSLKNLEYADFWYDQLAGQVSFVLEYRSDQQPIWQLWHSWSSAATYENCLTLDSATGCAASSPQNLTKQYRKRKRVPNLTNECDPITQTPYRQGYEFQAKLTISGPCRMKKARLWASEAPEPAVGSCPGTESFSALDDCPVDSLEYEIMSGTTATKS